MSSSVGATSRSGDSSGSPLIQPSKPLPSSLDFLGPIQIKKEESGAMPLPTEKVDDLARDALSSPLSEVPKKRGKEIKYEVDNFGWPTNKAVKAMCCDDISAVMKEIKKRGGDDHRTFLARVMTSSYGGLKDPVVSQRFTHVVQLYAEDIGMQRQYLSSPEYVEEVARKVARDVIFKAMSTGLDYNGAQTLFALIVDRVKVLGAPEKNFASTGSSDKKEIEDKVDSKWLPTRDAIKKMSPKDITTVMEEIKKKGSGNHRTFLVEVMVSSFKEFQNIADRTATQRFSCAVELYAKDMGIQFEHVSVETLGTLACEVADAVAATKGLGLNSKELGQLKEWVNSGFRTTVVFLQPLL